MNITDNPLAIPGLVSYRYLNRFGWVMIGATDDEDALREAARSVCQSDLPTTPDRLQRWDGTAYQPATSEQEIREAHVDGR